MKSLLTLCFLLITLVIVAQESNPKLIGSWVLCSRVYKSGKEVPAKLKLNESFIRFEFTDYGKAYKSTESKVKGLVFDYSVNGNKLMTDFITYRIVRLTLDSLILLEETKGAVSDSSFIYSFISETNYQDKIPLSPDMMIISENDTTYIENKKIRLNYNNIEPFEKLISSNVSQYVTSKNYFFMSTFIVNSDGSIDSIKIHKSISKGFDGHFKKAVKKSERFWIPAKVNGRNVKTIHKVVFAFDSEIKFYHYSTYFEDAILLIEQGNYLQAIYYLNAYLKVVPNDVEAIYNRGLCFYHINDFDHARNDWNKIKNKQPYKSNTIITKFVNNSVGARHASDTCRIKCINLDSDN